MLDLSQYLFSFACLLLAVGALALGAVRVRRRLLGGWSGPPAWLADSVLTLALLLWTAELLGVAGALSRIPLVLAAIAVGAALRLALAAPARGGPAPPAPSSGPWGRRLALAIAAVVGIHWLIATDAALGTGITNWDSAWYHMPFAAHFAQTGSTLSFDYVSPRYLAWFYPQNSELLHGTGIVLFHRDLLSPLLNMLWLGGCLGAAWCIGRPYGKGAWTVAAAAVLLDAGVMADQAGTARNDTLGIFFLLAALALLVNAAAADPERRPAGAGPLAVAGLAVGLAAGTKLSFIAPAAALVIAVPALARAGTRRRSLLAFGAPLLAGCGFWLARNTILAHNPLPWFRALGPLRLDGPEQGLGGKPQFSVLHYAGDGRVWSRWFEPGLSHRLGELWPLLLVLIGAVAVLCLLRRQPALRLAAIAAAAGVLAYLLDGTSAEGPPGMPDGFASSLRHLLPALFAALVLAPLALDLGRRRVRSGLAILLAALLVSSDLSATSWRPLYLALAAFAVIALLGPPVLRRSLPRLRGLLPRRPAAVPAAALAAAALALLLGGGWFVQRSYLDHRYDGHDFRSAGLNAAFAWASGQQRQRIATSVPLQYPLLGADLSNRVSFVGRRGGDAGFTLIHNCRPWRAALAAGRYRYVVTAGRLAGAGTGTSRCLDDDPRAKPVVRADKIVVFRLLQRRPDAERRGSGDGRSGGVRPLPGGHDSRS